MTTSIVPDLETKFIPLLDLEAHKTYKICMRRPFRILKDVIKRYITGSESMDEHQDGSPNASAYISIPSADLSSLDTDV
jgi:hypothetical protein